MGRRCWMRQKKKARFYTQEEFDKIVQERLSDALERILGATQESCAAYLRTRIKEMAMETTRSIDFGPMITAACAAEVSKTIRGLDFSGKDFVKFVREQSAEFVRRMTAKAFEQSDRSQPYERQTLDALPPRS